MAELRAERSELSTSEASGSTIELVGEDEIRSKPRGPKQVSQVRSQGDGTLTWPRRTVHASMREQ